ncbi:unnamed protein product [Rhizoctonia solani]|uniref:Uncharacterized protein n=1 Tax=Rhizoctonia solani TaxID=456999 RepID=A0A8H2ZUM3_9AGAM|nr:unnamed protein product [Rhizoctonia solani]
MSPSITIRVAHASVAGAIESPATHGKEMRQTQVSKLKNATKAAGYQIKTSLKAMSQSARALPPLKSALEDMSELIGIMVDVGKDDENIDELFTELHIRANALETYLTSPNLEWKNDALSLVFK